MVERWKRGAEGAETNAEGVRIEALPIPLPSAATAPRRVAVGAEGRGIGTGCPLPNRLRGLREHHELRTRSKTNLMTFVAARTLITTICLISVSLNTACCSLSLLRNDEAKR